MCLTLAERERGVGVLGGGVFYFLVFLLSYSLKWPICARIPHVIEDGLEPLMLSPQLPEFGGYHTWFYVVFGMEPTVWCSAGMSSPLQNRSVIQTVNLQSKIHSVLSAHVRLQAQDSTSDLLEWVTVIRQVP